MLILDEPFSGLDPLVANQMIEFLKIYHQKERTIFISSHDLNYVEKIASHIGVLNDSKLLFNSSLQDFTDFGINSIDIALLKILKPNPTVLSKIDWL
jgi:ABC-2 type transport system ATP-binding protein